MYMCAVKIRVLTTIFLCTFQSYYFIFAGKGVLRKWHEILDLVSKILIYYYNYYIDFVMN